MRAVILLAFRNLRIVKSGLLEAFATLLLFNQGPTTRTRLAAGLPAALNRAPVNTGKKQTAE